MSYIYTRTVIYINARVCACVFGANLHRTGERIPLAGSPRRFSPKCYSCATRVIFHVCVCCIYAAAAAERAEREKRAAAGSENEVALAH